jgi:hypothetical protein
VAQAADVVGPWLRACALHVQVVVGRTDGKGCVPYAFRTAAESMAVTPLRLTNAVGTPWRCVCKARSTQARASGAAVKAARRRRAVGVMRVQTMARKVAQLCRYYFFGMVRGGICGR